MEQLRGLLGILVFLLIALALSSDRSAVRLRIVAAGLLLQVLFAAVLTEVRPAASLLGSFAAFVNQLISFSQQGARFVFGSLVDTETSWGFIFAVQVVPAIVFFSSLVAVGYHLGLMQRLVAVGAFVFRRTLGISGAESMVVAANVFIGPTEAPLCVRPYIPRMTRSQLMLVMTSGYATISGAVLGAYVLMLAGPDDDARLRFARHLVTASVMSAPAAVLMAKILLPERLVSSAESVSHAEMRTARNIFDAAAAGAVDGLRLAACVAATLIAFVAFVSLINWPLESLSSLEPVQAWREQQGLPVFSVQRLLGWGLVPLAWMMGIPPEECATVGGLLGEQLVLTEFVAYRSLADLMHATPPELSGRTALIATYALCGFANFACLAVQLGGLSSMAPGRRADIASIAPRALAGGAMASWLTASIAGLFIPLS